MSLKERFDGISREKTKKTGGGVRSFFLGLEPIKKGFRRFESGGGGGRWGGL